MQYLCWDEEQLPFPAEFFQNNINKKGNREGLAEQFSDPTVRKNIEVDLSIADLLYDEIVQLENYMIRKTKAFDPRTYYRLQTVPGYGQVLGDFSQRIYHFAGLFARLLRYNISYIAHYAPDVAPPYQARGRL